MEVADLWVRLRALTGDFTASLGAATGEAGGLMGTLMGVTGKAGIVSALAIGAIGAASIKMASDFQDAMVRVQNLAGVPKSAMGELQAGVLGLAGQVGFAPTSLAEALYHVESSFSSTGITGKDALKILQTAAEGAKIGGANLVDVTNALDAAVVSGIPGVQDYGQAMSSLLTTVGSGDMTMQNLADAFSTGVLANAKVYGLTIKDVGAALATFGDNNIRGQVAATDLRMAIMDLTKQGKPGVAALKSIGIQAGQLGKDMQTGGLNKALTDLKQHLDAAGQGGASMGLFLETAFTKKSSAPMAVLLSQFDRLQSKYKELSSGPNFAEQWSTHLATFKQQFANFKAGLEAGLTKIGNVLLPIVTKALEGMNTAFHWLGEHPDVLKAIFVGLAAVAAPVVLGLVIGALSVLMGIVFSATGVIFALGAGFTYAYEHSKKFRTYISQAGNTLRNVLGTAFNWVAHTAIPALGQAFDWFKNGPLKTLESVFGYFSGWFKTNWVEISGTVSKVWTVISTVIQVQWALIWAYLGPALNILVSVWTLVWHGVVNVLKGVWDLIRNIVVENVHLVMNTLAVVMDLITGHWGKAWHDLGHLVSQAFSDIKNLIGGFASDAVNLLYQAGKDVVNGLVSGIKSMASAPVNAIESIGSSLTGGLKRLLGINSPSKVFHDIGSGIGEGLVNGIVSSHGNVMAATKALSGVVTGGFNMSPIVGPRMVGPNGAWVNPMSGGGGAYMGGYAGSSGGSTSVQLTVEMNSMQMAQWLFPDIQRRALTAERTNGNNGLSARRTSKV